MKDTLKNLNALLEPRQQGIINRLTEENPILDSIPVRAASHGIYNVYATASDVTPMQETDFDDELPTVGISFELGRTKLGKIGGKLPIPQDAAIEVGGYPAYAEARMPTIIAKSGNEQEYRIFYKGFLKSAIANGKAVSVGGTTPNKQYSLVAVTYDEDSTVGLYNPKTLSTGKIFEQLVLNGGNVGLIDVGGKSILGKIMVAYMQFGLQLADPRLVGALVNIEPTANVSDRDKIDGLPTAAQMDDLLAGVRAGANTVIYAHPALAKKMASKFQLPQRQVANGESSVRYALFDWQGIPFVTSYNLGWGNEAVISL